MRKLLVIALLAVGGTVQAEDNVMSRGAIKIKHDFQETPLGLDFELDTRFNLTAGSAFQQYYYQPGVTWRLPVVADQWDALKDFRLHLQLRQLKFGENKDNGKETRYMPGISYKIGLGDYFDLKQRHRFEVRDLVTHNFVFRYNTRADLVWKATDWIHPYIADEYHVTFDSDKSWTHRFNVGAIFPVNKYMSVNVYHAWEIVRNGDQKFWFATGLEFKF